ncbi:MAG: hypothetical protein EBZ49_07830 [Proteobacteria bacterium]|nr:hypothetical protein [Pseudomonadota bacterium]
MGKKFTLNKDELALLETPLAQLPKELRLLAFAVQDKIHNHNYELNKEFVSSAKLRPSIISDYMPGGAMSAVQSQADGKMYDSKSAYRKALKAGGYIEVGNEKQEAPKDRGDYNVRDALKQSIQQHLG